jgi:hypothetical protein
MKWLDDGAGNKKSNNPASKCNKEERKEEETHLVLNVREDIGVGNGKADEDGMRVGVAQGTQTVVVFLTWRLEKLQLQLLSIDLDIGVVSSHHRVLRLYITSSATKLIWRVSAEGAAETGEVAVGWRSWEADEANERRTG